MGGACPESGHQLPLSQAHSKAMTTNVEIETIEQTAVEETPAQPQAEAERPAVPVIVIEPSRGWVAVKLKELWEYRELLYFLTWRDIRVRYKQTALGAAWAIIQPFFSMVVFSIFFGRLAKTP